jgi:predicted phage tail protein
MGFFKSIFNKVTGVIGEVVSWFVDIPEPSAAGSQQSGFLVNKNSNIESIPVVYGERKIGGTRVFMATSGSDNTYLYMALVLCEGEIQAIGDVYIDDLLSTDSKYSGLVTITKYTGTDAQTADATLVGAGVGWTSNHRLRGLAYLAIRLKYDRNAFSSVPTIQAVVQGKKVFDPRNSTTAYSNNPALCLRDYLTNSRYGKGLDAALLDNTSFVAAANDCDNYIVSEYIGASANTKVFQCNAILDTSQTLFNNVNVILRCMRGLMPFQNGVYRIIVEDDEASTFAFSLNNIVGGLNIASVSKDRRYNKVTARFINPLSNWQEDTIIFPTAGSADETTFLAEDNGIELSTEIDLQTTTNQYIAKDFARVVCLASRLSTLSVSLTATSDALKCAVGDVVTITHPTPSWTNKEFRVTSIRMLENGEVEVALQEHIASVYPWDAEAQIPATAASNLPNPFSVVAPTSLTVTPASFIQPDGTAVPVLNVAWTASTDQFVVDYEVQYRKGTDAYQSILTKETSIQIQNVLPTQVYDVRVRANNSIGASSLFLSVDDSTAIGDSTAPAAPTSLAAVGGIGAITLTWTNPSDADLDVIQVYEGTTSVQGGATLIATTKANFFVRSSLSEGVTRYYWVKAVDYSGNVSGFNSPTGVFATTEIGVDPTRFVGRIEVVDTLTTGLGPADVGKVEFLTTDETLYKWNGTAWVTGVVIEDDVGTILAQHLSVVQLDAITANMGTLTAGKLQNADSTFVVDLDNKTIFIS